MIWLIELICGRVVPAIILRTGGVLCRVLYYTGPKRRERP